MIIREGHEEERHRKSEVQIPEIRISNTNDAAARKILSPRMQMNGCITNAFLLRDLRG